MAPPKRKRTRGRRNPAEEERRPSKRKAPVDEEIDSDEADGPEDGNGAPPPHHEETSDEEPENETAEEKRLRLARAYLRHVGVSEDAPFDKIGSDAGSEGDDDGDAGNALLREQALLKSGKAVAKLADKLKPALSSVSLFSRKGHACAPTCISLSKDDGLTAVSGGKDSAVMIWDVATQTRKLAFKPKIVKSAGGTAKPVSSNGHVGAVYCTAITDDGKTAISGGADGLIRVWDVRAGKLISHLKGHRGPVYGLALRSSQGQLFSASHDRTVKIWDINDLAYVETLFGHGGEVSAIDAMVSERAVSCGRDGTIRLYKVVEDSQLLFRSVETVSIDTVAVMNEQRFVSGGDDGTIALWQVNKRKATAEIKHAHGRTLGCESWISSICCFRNADIVVSGGGDGHVRFWKTVDVSNMAGIGAVKVGPGFINGMALDNRHRVMAVAVGNEHRLGRWSRIRGAKNSIHFMKIPDHISG